MLYIKNIYREIRIGQAMPPPFGTSSGVMAEGVPTNNQRIKSDRDMKCASVVGRGGVRG